MAAEDEPDADGVPKKSSRGGLVIGLVLALLGGAGGFAFTSGMFFGGASSIAKAQPISGHLAFVPIEPMTVSLGDPSQRRFLRFRASLEVDKSVKSDIENMLPRVIDVLNTYLRSLSLTDIEDPSSLLTLRSQMRRRIDLVVGGNRVHDLLVLEFVVN